MFDQRRSLLGAAGALALALTAVCTTGSAQAAATNRDLDHVLTVPATAPSPASAAAEPPTTWPKADKIVHIPAGGSLACASGNLCVAAWDSTKQDYAVFSLYYCDTYTVSNFLGTGRYENAQTGGATARFYGQSGNLLTSVPAGAHGSDYNWNPVWSIKNC